MKRRKRETLKDKEEEAGKNEVGGGRLKKEGIGEQIWRRKRRNEIK